ncbi:Gfo/Idh/MocA family oxidoreductase [Puteibacter caeruleilacunae]|nr:Gfo/Idh/MocA family oxidoreductase [Puteibacter caeruleilacunae]
MKQVNWGIIGCGNVTEQKSGPAFNLIDDSSLVAVMRRNGELAKDYAHRHRVPKWYDNADALINDPDVNAIYIATPPDTHCSYAIQALKAGKPVYVEKPMALNFEQCQQMIETSNQTGIPLFVAYYRRSLPLFVKIKELIEQGTIGKPMLVNLRFYRSPSPSDLQTKNPAWRVIPEISGGGHFVDLAAHQLDYLSYILGEITEENGFSTNHGGLYPAEDTVSATWKHSSGVTATGNWCFTCAEDTNIDTIDIIGDQGKIEFSTFKFSPIKVKTPHGEKEFYFEKPTHVEQYFIQTVVSELLGNEKSPANVTTAANTTRVMERILGKDK